MNGTPLSMILCSKLAAASVLPAEGAFVAMFSGTTADSDAACDKTFAQIKAAFDAGRTVVFQYAAATETVELLKSSVGTTQYNGAYTTLVPDENAGIASGTFVYCGIVSDDTVTCSYIVI